MLRLVVFLHVTLIELPLVLEIIFQFIVVFESTR